MNITDFNHDVTDVLNFLLFFFSRTVFEQWTSQTTVFRLTIGQNLVKFQYNTATGSGEALLRPDSIPAETWNFIAIQVCSLLIGPWEIWLQSQIKLSNFQLISLIKILSILCEIAIRWMPQHLTDH